CLPDERAPGRSGMDRLGARHRLARRAGRLLRLGSAAPAPQPGRGARHPPRRRVHHSRLRGHATHLSAAAQTLARVVLEDLRRDRDRDGDLLLADHPQHDHGARSGTLPRARPPTRPAPGAHRLTPHGRDRGSSSWKLAAARPNPIERRMNRFLREPPSVRGAAATIVTATATVVVLSGIAMRIFDHSQYKNIWVGMWWALQTVTTVGYGDVTPTKPSGRLVASFVMLEGIAFLAIITAAITSTFVARAAKERELADRAAEEAEIV